MERQVESDAMSDGFSSNNNLLPSGFDSRGKRLARNLFAEVDIAWLVVFRVVFGALMLWETWRFYAHGWIEAYYILPKFHFKYYGFAWVNPWPGEGMYVHFAVLAAAAVGIMLGFCYRVSVVVFCIGFTYVFLLDSSLYLNHFYLINLISLQMVFIPAHRAWSIDAWLRPKIRSTTVPAWTLWDLRLHIGLPYFFGGIAKFDRDWLLGIPMLEMLVPNVDLPIVGQYLYEWWVADVFAFGGLLFDLLVVPLLLWRRTRVFAFVLCVCFHLTNKLLLNIGVFPWLMIAGTLAFFPPDWPRRLAKRLGRAGGAAAGVPPPAVLGAGQRITLCVLAVYTAVQLLLPFRHWLYPGYCGWSEEGQRYSWMMKLRGKDGMALFWIVDPKTGQAQPIDPAPYLTERQRRKLGGYPDLVLQFAHFLHKQLAELGYEDFEVRAEVWTSLNHREPRLLIDPTVNLAAQPWDLWPAPWIRRLDEPLPTEYLRRPVPKLQNVDEAQPPERDDNGTKPR